MFLFFRRAQVEPKRLCSRCHKRIDSTAANRPQKPSSFVCFFPRFRGDKVQAAFNWFLWRILPRDVRTEQLLANSWAFRIEPPKVSHFQQGFADFATEEFGFGVEPEGINGLARIQALQTGGLQTEGSEQVASSG